MAEPKPSSAADPKSLNRLRAHQQEFRIVSDTRLYHPGALSFSKLV